MVKIVLIRHGESVWNKENRFTGWTDVDLSQKGVAEAREVAIWRRSYRQAPPPLTRQDSRFPGNDPLYKNINVDDLPLTESLKDTVERFLPYWRTTIEPLLRENKRVLVVAHGNSLRALVKHLDGVSDEDIVKLEIPTGAPLIYELEDSLKPLKSYYLH